MLDPIVSPDAQKIEYDDLNQEFGDVDISGKHISHNFTICLQMRKTESLKKMRTSKMLNLKRHLINMKNKLKVGNKQETNTCSPTTS